MPNHWNAIKLPIKPWETTKNTHRCDFDPWAQSIVIQISGHSWKGSGSCLALGSNWAKGKLKTNIKQAVEDLSFGQEV